MKNFASFRKSRTAAICLAATLSAGGASADQVFNDDVIITFSLCVGNDCVNGESFGFDTIKLKENNTRIKFDDTSTTSAFPNFDWQLTANETSNGGLNKFSIDDITSSRTPFTVEGGARNHAVYVDDAGHVGFKTSTPVVDLHTVNGNTPTLRLEQDGSNGFTPQTWDIAGNEANFFIRDVTNGSRLSFKIKPGAPENSLFVAADGDIGLGTQSPTGSLHVRGTDSVALKLDNTGGGVSIQLDAGGETTDFWQITSTVNDGILRFNRTGGDTEFEVDSSGNITIPGTITTSGSCSGGCDRVFDADYDLPSIEKHASLMRANRHLPGVGPTIEGQPMNLTHKVEGILNELEKAHIYIEQLHKQNTDMGARIGELHARLEAIGETK